VLAALAGTALAGGAFGEPPDTGCLNGLDGNFSGWSSDADGPGGFTLQHSIGGGRRLCARVRGSVQFDEQDGSILHLPAGSSVLIETRGERDRRQRMLITAEDGRPRYSWWLNGASRVVDDDARAWLDDALEVVAAFQAIGAIQGKKGSLQGRIGSIQGEVGSLQGKIGAIQGRIGSLQGKVGSIQGEQGGLRGAIGGHRGAIGGLQAGRSRASAALRTQIDREIEEHEAAIRTLEREIERRGFERRIQDAEVELRAAGDEARSEIARLERQIVEVRAEERIRELRKQIEDLHAEDRIREIERRMRPALDRLRARVDRLGS
jgi:chromosome segregation ATPase